MGFPEELMKNRKRADLTQEELAEKCSVSRQAVAKWEKGEALPDIYTVARLAKLFGCSIEDLIWPKEFLAENKCCYLRPMEEHDKAVLSPTLRQLAAMGPLLQELDRHVDDPMENDHTVWDGFVGPERFTICEKASQEVLGYLAFDCSEKNMTSLTIQISKPERFSESNYDLIREFLDHFAAERGIRAMCAMVHTDAERRIYESFGYTDVETDLILTFPI